MKLRLAVPLMMILAGPAAAGVWVCALQDSVVVTQPAVRLADLAAGDLPPAAGQLVVGGIPRPGGQAVFGRKTILRRLVTSGLASGVRFQGAAETLVIREGRVLSRQSLHERARQLLTPLLPTASPGAPNTTFELILPERLPAFGSAGEGDILLQPATTLAAGRSHRDLVLTGNGRFRKIPITVVVHHYREIPRARLKIGRGDRLSAELFDWEWVDVGAARQKTDLHGRQALADACCSRTIQAGQYLRASDLKPVPVVQAGDRVELTLQRGVVTVSVPATARQEGPVGKVIPVRNELTKRLVNARITGPGSVEWR